MATRRKKLRQGSFDFKSWGGARVGAGRKPAGDRAGVSHGPRAALANRYPVHVTLRLRRELPSLRRAKEYAVLREAFVRGCERAGFRLTHYSVQRDHLHLIVEAGSRQELSRGMQGLCVRIARGLNRLWSRMGSVFADRYHDRILRTPREVRNALAYVLNNARKHGVQLRRALDLFSSGAWFDGWRERLEVVNRPVAVPIAAARTWLLRVGWRRHRLLSLEEVPGG